MSKFGWSYPPGVSESMLPGNSREEQEAEAMVESFYEILSPLRKFYSKHDGAAAEEAEDEIVDALVKIASKVYDAGMTAANNAHAEAEEHARDVLNRRIAEDD